ncbi:zinc transport system permease protein [Thermosyntropha lipolytica DSM 11003]|uniref:Zinc transport system permease protein n=1 Tax=Thermosyntropha lipolytica DSM 11003 TaxID=1123382 RepID=A0A1M5JGE3_9FIRM|nr:metal ABC transporter permease [Thermosyntropha lipolytica]SHG39617.1 zinc transport system permease protein [Thermosyntropha lipolytica DSM 11003]
MMDFLQYDFARQAMLAGVLVSIACGVVGTYVVVKRIVFISGSMAHIAYGGIGLGYFLGINPIWGAFAFTALSAWGIGFINYRAGQKEDTIIGIMWAASMALGIILIQMSAGYTADLMSYLFGNILTVPREDLIFTGVLDIIILLVVYCFFEEFRAVAFDEEFARTVGVNTEKIYLLLLFLIAMTVVVMIRAVGVILVIALLTIPPTIAAQYTSSISRMMLISVLLGSIFTVGGLWLSFYLDLASGATMVLLAVAGFFISLALRGIKNRRLMVVEERNNFYENG